ncbi:MAG: hypothetical protein LLF92_12500 [Planctomycetaceae bacterium]|nr:hypothetical protein [Planctomycetaceae bacterium]
MNIEIQYVLAKSEGWEQLIILAVIFGFAILKKVFSAIKDYSEQHSDSSDDSTAYEELPKHKPAYHATHTYDKNAFKTIEQIRDERAAAIRARYGIPEPGRPKPQIPMADEPPPLEEEPIREHMFEPPPVRIEPPAYIPQKPKKMHVAAPPRQPEYVQPAYVMSAAMQSVPQAKKHKHTEHAAEVQRETLISLSSPQDLRTAILYQEILGKPLALREN